MKNGKAQNLGILSTIKGINVPRFVVIHPDISKGEQVKVICNFLKNHPGGTVAVRSSASLEDSSEASFAGMFTTKLRVEATVQAIQSAIEEVRFSGKKKEKVVAHYAGQRGLELTKSGMSVIVQEMIEGDMSGVIFSHDLAKPDGYYVVSVSSGVGETIVGGAINGKLIRIARGVKSTDIKYLWLRQLVDAMKTIEQKFRSLSLDVEFVVKGDVLDILQCRPITTTQVATDKALEGNLLKQIELVNASIASQFRGDVLGDMIDINPAELLGTNPTLLDISIFNYLFAEKIVERVRRDMGYDPLDVGLLRVVAGKPYASMRATSFSFRPLGISREIYEKIVRVYRDALVKNPALQSRVEFDLYAMSCGDKLERVMQEAQLSDNEKHIVRDAFLHIDTVFSQVSRIQVETFNDFASNYEQLTGSISDASLDVILKHVADGTEMFVRVARLAFYWKNRFEEMYPEENLNNLISGHIESVNSRLQSDLVACQKGTVTREELIQRYGHLRPGQFSVFSEAYADDPDTYLFAQMERMEIVASQRCAHDFEDKVDFKNVIVFMQARERMKFLFSQSLHLFVTKLKHQLNQRGISESEAADINWETLEAYLRGVSRLDTKRKQTPQILLPDVLIPGITDLGVITFTEAMPSYITNSIVKARVFVLERLGMKADVRGCLVLLPNADPGYDFLFHSGAVGIITKVGGPASHMCIRSIELQMPACIGCGESVYQKLMSAHATILDCSMQQIIILD